ncbi:MAG: alpha-amylase [Candidatus Altiarchaeales archaeon HGW-Altiarchaeales-2]|nr:MAG: alpha-amylase [Candidatus Altiarchaeales archaeon HGW-Altiarchaeales-2]
MLLGLIDKFKNQNKRFKIAFSITGTWLEQCEKYDKDLIETFKQMAESGCVEFIDETYYHSLSGLFADKSEFREQVKLHRNAMKEILNFSPKVFRNTELLYNNEIAKEVENLGYKGIFTEGIERILEGRSPNFIYDAKTDKPNETAKPNDKSDKSNLAVLLKNYKLSDDIAFRFSWRSWNEFPLTADKYAEWLSACEGDVINLCMDYETFGEHQWAETGIFEFLKFLPDEILKHENLDFLTPTEAISKYKGTEQNKDNIIDVPWDKTISWADTERDHSAWLGNHNQLLCFSEVQRLAYLIDKISDESAKLKFKKVWRYLFTSDHYHYMSTKNIADQEIHNYFSNRTNAYDAAVNLMSKSIIISATEPMLMMRR